MYHRVLPRDDQRFSLEEPGMVVQPETFQMHLRELKKHFELVSLTDWVNAKDNDEPLPQKACAVTFDDGWLDNYEYAFPILKEESVPATLFAVADKIETDFQFWPNIIAGLMVFEGISAMRDNAILRKALSSCDPVSGRVSGEQVASVIKALKAHTDVEIFQALESIGWRKYCGEHLGRALMGWQQLNEMRASGLVTVGSHTSTHRRLTSSVTLPDMEYEIVDSKRKLQRETGDSIDLFCFPNGDYNREALDMVRTHYRAAVTTRRGINLNHSASRHELTRIGIHEDIASNRRLFGARISGWV